MDEDVRTTTHTGPFLCHHKFSEDALQKLKQQFEDDIMLWNQSSSLAESFDKNVESNKHETALKVVSRYLNVLVPFFPLAHRLFIY